MGDFLSSLFYLLSLSHLNKPHCQTRSPNKMGDFIEITEVWLVVGVIQILTEYPLLPAHIISSLMKVASSAVRGCSTVKREVKFSATTKRRKFEVGGRRFADDFSLQSIPKWMRKRVVPPSSFEVDIANCYPTIMLGLCEDRVPCPTLKDYVRNRNGCIDHVSRSLGVNKDKAKELILIILNFGNWKKKLAEERKISVVDVPVCQFLDDLKADSWVAREYIKESSMYKRLKSEIEKKQPGETHYRYDTLTMASVLEANERCMLDGMMKVCAEEFSIFPSTLLHDGFIVSKAVIHGSDITIDPDVGLVVKVADLESRLSKAITDLMGYNVEIKVYVKFCLNK